MLLPLQGEYCRSLLSLRFDSEKALNLAIFTAYLQGSAYGITGSSCGSLAMLGGSHNVHTTLVQQHT